MLTVRAHLRRLRAMTCVVSNAIPVTIHHCHGGSMRDVLGARHPGMGQRSSDFLTIPLHASLHVGKYGIDTGMGRFRGVPAWEAEFGTQVDHLDRMCRILGYNVWRLADIDRDVEGVDG